MSTLKVLSKADALSSLEIINDSLSAETAEDLKALVRKLRILIPYDYAACLIGKRENNALTGSFELINVTFPAEWLAQYVIKGFHTIDPIVKENFSHFTMQHWADTYKKHGAKKEFVKAAEDFGLKKGCSIGFKNRSGTEGSLFSLSGKDIENNRRTAVVMQQVYPHLHNVLSRVSGRQKEDNNGNRIVLTTREKEVLRWVSFGKSYWDASMILNISERTVKFHMHNIMQKLNTVNRSHTVATALDRKLIELAG